MNNTWKFGLITVAILGVILWLAIGGIDESKAYYKTIDEVKAMGDGELEKRLRVAGDVMPGSIVRDGSLVRFTLIQDDLRLPVIYNGTEPLPDTFRDNAQALADGRMATDGTFYAKRIQAKCASKYAPKEAGSDGAVSEVINNKAS
ncbi:MAG: cytochrome c maturation protein CcmE [Bryobacterales bacterium]|nr:cytochrome c maturation protein CcmE [Bryobacterales bacterium]